MKVAGSQVARFFGVITKAYTYTNLLYLFLAFPLSIVFFVFVITLVSVSTGLIPIFIGLLLLYAVFHLEYGLLVFERGLNRVFFRETWPSFTLQPMAGGAWRRIKAVIADAFLWKGVLYFTIKFFLSTFTFMVEISLLCVSVTLAFLPLFLLIRRGDDLDFYIEQAWNYPLLIICLMPVGFFLIFVTLHAVNGLAKLQLHPARTMIRR